MSIRKYQFNYDVAPEQAAEQLRRSVKATQNVVGKVSADGVKLERRLPFWFHNSFDPIFVGSFSNTTRGALLAGRFRTSWFTWIFMAIFIGLCAKNLFHTWSLPTERVGFAPDWRQDQLRFQSLFLGLALVFPGIGWALGTWSRQAILKAIENSSTQPGGIV